MKSVLLMIVLVFVVVAPSADLLAQTQEEEIPVIFDRSWTANRLDRTSEQYLEIERSLVLDLMKSEIALSPDGQWIAFTARTLLDLRALDIGIVPVAGGEPVILYSIPEDQLFRYTPDDYPEYAAEYIGGILSLTFSPDSGSVIFCRDYYDADKGSRYEYNQYSDEPGILGGSFSSTGSVTTIEQVDIATGEVSTLIEEGSKPNWSADGRYFAYVHFDHRFFLEGEQSEHHGVPAVYDRETGETRFMSDVSSTYTSPVFGPWEGKKYTDVIITEDNSALICSVLERDINGSSRAMTRISLATGEESIIPIELEYLRFLGRIPGGRYIMYTDQSPYITQTVNCLLDTETNEVVWAFKDNPSDNECGSITPDGDSIIYLKHFDWSSPAIDIPNATMICRSQIDIPQRFIEGNSPPPPELPDDYGVIAEFGRQLSDIDTHLGGSSPIWSPDGEIVAFADIRGRIWTVSRDGGEPVMVYNNPDMSYQGHSIFVFNNHVYGYTADGSEILFSKCAVDEARGSVPELTETGGYIWIGAMSYLYAVNVNTGDVRTVIEGGDTGAYSPDGQYLAYTVYDDSKDTGDPFIEAHKEHTIIRDLATGEETVLNFRERWQCIWTTDSQALMMSTDTGFGRVPVDGSEPEILTTERFSRYTVIPGEESVVYGKSNSLYCLNFASGESTRIFPEVNGEFLCPSLSPDGTKLAYYVDYEGKSTYNPYSTQNRTHLFVTDFSQSDPSPTAVADAAPAPELLIGNYPNPFNPATTISFSLPADGVARLDIYNLAGQKVRELVNGDLTAGMHEVVWNGRNDTGMPLASGLYIARIAVGSHLATQRMLMMK